MTNTFSQKFLMMILAGFVAACLLWAFRHIVEQALYETSDAGYKESVRKQQEAKAAREREQRR